LLQFSLYRKRKKKEKWLDQEGWEIQRKAFLMKVSAAAIQDLDLINGS